jgi:hypothetical protein
MNTTLTRTLGAALGLGLALGLGACSSDEPELPSLGGATESALADAATDLSAVTTAFHSCLSNAGLPAIIEDYGSGLPQIVTFSESVAAMGVDAEGQPTINEKALEDTEALVAFYEEVDAASGPTTPKLMIDGIDHSEAWARCLDETGYSLTELNDAVYDSALAVDVYQRMVDANNEWAACARANGYPDVADTQLPAKIDGSSTPMVLLPTSMTPDQLRALLSVCPNFDPERAAQSDAAWEEVDMENYTLPDDYYTYPLIGFDYPGFDGSADVSITYDSTDETTARLNELIEIIWEPMTAYALGE